MRTGSRFGGPASDEACPGPRKSQPYPHPGKASGQSPLPPWTRVASPHPARASKAPPPTPPPLPLPRRFPRLARFASPVPRCPLPPPWSSRSFRCRGLSPVPDDLALAVRGLVATRPRIAGYCVQVHHVSVRQNHRRQLDHQFAAPLHSPGPPRIPYPAAQHDSAGITTFPSIITGNKVSKYTGSPGRALRVDTALCSTSGICVPAGTMIFATAATAGTAGEPALELVPFAPGTAEPTAAVPAAGAEAASAPAAGADCPEAGAPADPSCGFCVAGCLAGADAEDGGGGDIGPASCAATGSAHPAVMTNTSTCGKWSGLFVI